MWKMFLYVSRIFIDTNGLVITNTFICHYFITFVYKISDHILTVYYLKESQRKFKPEIEIN